MSVEDIEKQRKFSRESKQRKRMELGQEGAKTLAYKSLPEAHRGYERLGMAMELGGSRKNDTGKKQALMLTAFWLDCLTDEAFENLCGLLEGSKSKIEEVSREGAKTIAYQFLPEAHRGYERLGMAMELGGSRKNDTGKRQALELIGFWLDSLTDEAFVKICSLLEDFVEEE